MRRKERLKFVYLTIENSNYCKLSCTIVNVFHFCTFRRSLIVCKKALYTWDTYLQFARHVQCVFELRVARAAGLLTLLLVSAHFRQTAGSWIVMEQLVMSLYRNYCCEDIFPSIQRLLFYCSWHYKFDCYRLVPQHFRLKGIQEDSVRAGSSALSAIRISESASVFFIPVSFVYSTMNYHL